MIFGHKKTLLCFTGYVNESNKGKQICYILPTFYPLRNETMTITNFNQLFPRSLPASAFVQRAQDYSVINNDDDENNEHNSGSNRSSNFKIGRARSARPIYNYKHDYSQNCTTRGLITN